jgi:hypothetical protein
VLTHEAIATRLSGSALGNDGGFQTMVTSKANRTNAIDVSTNLAIWTGLTNLANRTGNAQFSDPTATNYDRRYYRARLLP